VTYKKHSLLLAALEDLQRRNVNVTTLHLQKAMYLLQTIGVDVPFEFVFYRHSPHSFDIDLEIEQMKSYWAVMAQPTPEKLTALRVSSNAGIPKTEAPLSTNEEAAIRTVCAFIAGHAPRTIDLLSIAAWIQAREHRSGCGSIVERLRQLKPQVSAFDAEKVCKELDIFFSGVRRQPQLGMG
jgi:hypothetical protein